MLLELSESVFLTQHFWFAVVRIMWNPQKWVHLYNLFSNLGRTCPVQLLLTLLISLSLLLPPIWNHSSFYFDSELHNNLFWLLHVFSSASCIYLVYTYIGSLENVKYINFKHPIEELNICSYLFKCLQQMPKDNWEGVGPHKEEYIHQK